MKSIIEKNLSEIRAIECHINDFKNRLTELEKGREQCTTLQFLKKRDFDKQISDCKEKIKEPDEQAIERDFDIRGFVQNTCRLAS